MIKSLESALALLTNSGLKPSRFRRMRFCSSTLHKASNEIISDKLQYDTHELIRKH